MSVVLGVSIGLVGPVHWAVLPIDVVSAAVPFVFWARRIAFPLRMYCDGVAVPGRVTRSDGEYASEDTHVKVRHSVEYDVGDGIARVIEGKDQFLIADKPAVGDSAEVYYLPKGSATAVVVFASRRRTRWY